MSDRQHRALDVDWALNSLSEEVIREVIGRGQSYQNTRGFGSLSTNLQVSDAEIHQNSSFWLTKECHQLGKKIEGRRCLRIFNAVRMGPFSGETDRNYERKECSKKKRSKTPKTVKRNVRTCCIAKGCKNPEDIFAADFTGELIEPMTKANG
ncbi:hypothetical protein B0H19DRAFT_1086058 [Mycena capillaripes]|nr:hypothetical protein B0H19DRAFT_1086058 [Mycena capillaripes]